MDQGASRTIFYCGVGLSSAAYCAVLVVAALSPAWRKSSLNWAWLFTTGLNVLAQISSLFIDPNNDNMSSWFRCAFMFLDVTSHSWMLAGGYVAMKRDRGEESRMAPALLFTALTSIPGPLIYTIVLHCIDDHSKSWFFFILLHDILYQVQIFMTAFSSVGLYAYGLWYIRRSHSRKDLPICVTFLIFAVFLLFHSILIKIFLIMFYEGNDRDFAIYLLSNLPTINSLGVFLILIVHLVFNKDNISLVYRPNQTVTADGDGPNERLSLEARE